MSPLTDLELVRRYEPILRYTKGETFFPMDVDRYLRDCSLWVHHANGAEERLVEEGGLTLENLGELRAAEFGAVHYLKFIEHLDIARIAASLAQAAKTLVTGGEFKRGLGRLARVGYASRILDAIFSLTLYLRGRVPFTTATTAAAKYRQMQAEDEKYVYYGRVFREQGWIALQYWYFYAFNNWRTGFHGVNDHEADWEMVMVYLYAKPDGTLAPRWAAYASHDYQGDDLRRRWDDHAELEIVEEHPVVYAAAGSHASYFRRGEYLTEIEIPALGRVAQILNSARTFWAQTLRQAGGSGELNLFRIPFVDYARGDSIGIGPGQAKVWTAHLLDPVPEWVSQYRGLWGLYAQDPISGENAPAGPMYNRDGLMRSSWYNPLGWAGLDKTPTPPEEIETLARRCAALRARQNELSRLIDAKTGEIQQWGVELAALKGHPHLAKRSAALEKQAQTTSVELKALRKERSDNHALLEALARRSTRLQMGKDDPPRAHIRRMAQPADPRDLHFGRLAEIWAALSIGVLLVGFVILLATAHTYVVFAALALVAALVFVEAVFRRELGLLLRRVAVALAIVAALILIYAFFWQILAGGVIIAGAFLIWENIRELRG